jgi:hypothetical protein
MVHSVVHARNRASIGAVGMGIYHSLPSISDGKGVLSGKYDGTVRSTLLVDVPYHQHGTRRAY